MSGGVDSSYLCYIARKVMHLRPLIHSSFSSPCAPYGSLPEKRGKICIHLIHENFFFIMAFTVIPAVSDYVDEDFKSCYGALFDNNLENGQIYQVTSSQVPYMLGGGVR